jgi:ubiquinone/menaquinone biosynthesis C-methylase UbiE
MSYSKQYDIGIIGLALLRNWLVGDNEKAHKMILELRALLNNNKDSLLESNSLGLSKGYQEWSKTYDSTPNLLINVEHKAVEKLLQDIPKGKALDVACGTGRYCKFLKKIGYEVTGIDISIDMLNKAKANVPNVNFVRDNFEKMKFPDSSFDLSLSALALTHSKKLDNVIKEIARVTKKGGFIILSDIHPWATLLGGQAYFYDTNGNYSFVKNYIHWHSSYLKSFRGNGLKVIDCVEPVVKKSDLDLMHVWLNLEKDTISEALENLPLALIWKLEKI